MRFVHDLCSTRHGRALPWHPVGINALARLIALDVSTGNAADEIASGVLILTANHQAMPIARCRVEARRATPVTNGERRHS